LKQRRVRGRLWPEDRRLIWSPAAKPGRGRDAIETARYAYCFVGEANVALEIGQTHLLGVTDSVAIGSWAAGAEMVCEVKSPRRRGSRPMARSQ
jgi:hypothetical protein